MGPSDLSQCVKDLAATLGFERCGIATAGPIGRANYLREWLQGGRGGSMEYLSRHIEKRSDPRALLAGARSIVVVALVYNQQEPPAPTAADTHLNHRARIRETPEPQATSKLALPGLRESFGTRCCNMAHGPIGRVARYAWGEDYHVVIKDKLFDMARRLKTVVSIPFQYKVCVDTAPLLEREVAAAAGVGWIGKNTMVLDHRLGSYFFLGAMLTTLEMRPDAPEVDRCGTCSACLDACPTGAFPAPYQMDASRCISYLTIEHRGKISEYLQPMMADWIFGCDVCQEVCPHNRNAPTTNEPRFTTRPAASRLPLEDVLDWTAEDYRSQLRGSAMRRAKLDMLQRNARIAMSNLDARPGSHGVTAHGQKPGPGGTFENSPAF